MIPGSSPFNLGHLWQFETSPKVPFTLQPCRGLNLLSPVTHRARKAERNGQYAHWIAHLVLQRRQR